MMQHELKIRNGAQGFARPHAALRMLAALSLACLPALLVAAPKDAPASPPEKRTAAPNTTGAGPELSGALWAGYEFLDHTANGNPDSAGPTQDGAGFRLGRAYMNLKGKGAGALSKWKYRLTMDLSSAARHGDGCGADSLCSENNGYLVFMKYAFFDVPLPLGISLRVGQQVMPSVDGGESGSNPNKLWGYRYLDLDGKMPWDEWKLSSSTDRGVGLFYSMKYIGAHVVLHNGEHYQRNNAERVAGKNDTLTELASGSADSYGYDLSGRVSVRPFGDEGKHQLHLMLPFRFNAVAGVDDSELSRTSVDWTDPARPRWYRLQGDKRAWKDSSYGTEAAYEGLLPFGIKLGLGLGAATYIDRRGTSYIESHDGSPLGLADYTCATGRVCRLEDQRAYARFAYAHLEWNRFGVFGRVMNGSGKSTSVSSALAAAQGGEYWQVALRQDIRDGQLGNLSFAEARNLDLARARFHKSVFGVSYSISDGFRVAAGVSRLVATDAEGRPQKENELERVYGAGGLPSASAQVNTQIKSANTSNVAVTTNDLIGKRSVVRQVFIRSELQF